MVKAKFGQSISRLRYDNGGEYTSNEFKDFCKSNGIEVEPTVAYTPHQNGVAERMNLTLMNKVRPMLYESGLNKELWNEAVMCATFLTNRSPTSALNGENSGKTPSELWYGKRPNVEKFRVFGSAAYCHIPKQKRVKLDWKSTKNVMVGYAPNGYRLWDSENRKIVIARDVIFDERLKSPGASPVCASDESSILIEQEKADDNDGLVIEAPIINNESDASGQVNEMSNSHLHDNFLNNSNMTDDLDGAITEGGESDSNDDTVINSPNLRRSTRETRKPDRYGDAVSYTAMALSAEDYIDDVPLSIVDIKFRPDSAKWMEAVNREMNSLLQNNTWVLTELPEGRSTVDCKWVFKRKHDQNGLPCEYKARLVARGFSQRKGFDYQETYSPVAKIASFRILLAIAAQFNLEIHQMDVKTAFLNGNLNEEIYMTQPDGFAKDNLVCKLNKSIYGLKQASRMWNDRFHQFIVKLGFQRSEYDYCLYVIQDNNITVYLLLYVDDLILVGNNLIEINRIKSLLSAEFEMKDMKELKYFLGISIERDIGNGTLFISQEAYLKNVLKRFGMENCKGTRTPMELNVQLPRDENAAKTSMPYKELIGCLMYVVLTSRPDLSASVNYLSQFQSCATDTHYQHLKRILRYIKQTAGLKLIYQRTESAEPLIGYADADYANDQNDRKSISGFVFKVFGSTITWSSRKQNTIALSSTEAEYIALSSAACEAVWIRGFLQDIGIKIEKPTKIYEDNQACIGIAEEPREHKRMKHIDVKYNKIRELVFLKMIKVLYVPSAQQLADIFTKSLPANSFEYLRSKLNLK